MTDTTFPERSSREQIQHRQLTSLRSLVGHLLSQPGYWYNRLTESGITPDTLQRVEDLARIPLTTKQDLAHDQARLPPYGSLWNASMGAPLRLHQTSGTTGRPLIWLDSRRNWDWILSCWEQNYRMIGLRPDDRLGFLFSFGPFLGFWAAFEGAQRGGHLCVAGGGLSTSARLKLIDEHRLTVICCTPTYALRMVEVAHAEGVNLQQNSVRGLIVAGEPGGCLPTTRSRIEEAWGARVFDHWGMTEIGPLATECADDPGHLYVLEGECLPEIIDPQTGAPVSSGETGELVITNLGRVDSPLLRYRTGDLVRGEYVPEVAGYHLLRLTGGILGRTDEMFTIRGNNVYPAVLEELLREFPEIVEYQIHVLVQKAMTHLRIEVEPLPTVSGPPEGSALTERISRRIKDRLNFQADIQLVAPDTLPRFEMKGRRFQRHIET